MSRAAEDGRERVKQLPADSKRIAAPTRKPEPKRPTFDKKIDDEVPFWLRLHDVVEEALDKLGDYMAERGDHGDLVLPLVGTGRGRIQLPRKKIIERIAQSFAYASRERTFANKLTIVIHPSDAAKYDVNLFEVRDYLVGSLDV